MQQRKCRANLSKENKHSKLGESTMRITRARAKELIQSGGLPPLHPSSKQDERQVLRPTSKRAASEENEAANNSVAGRQRKKRAVLGDVTNIICKTSYTNCIDVPKVQVAKPAKQDKKGSARRKEKVVPAVIGKKPNDKEEKGMNNVAFVKSKEDLHTFENPKVHKLRETVNTKECGEETLMPMKQKSKYVGLRRHQQEGSKSCQEEGSDDYSFIDIDGKTKDPLMCGLYAPDIYRTMSAIELGRRPSADYMVKLQKDITHSMRSILIDWLVEVSEEYRLVPDTLYLTVNLIDRFLAGNYLEKQKLQLLGVTCMLIASKYEEICAPRVEEFCFITDNTYAKDEVVVMENKVLNYLEFQLSVPTTKKFLRRFIQAAQASYKVPSVQLEFLANYLAELTLLEYSFVKYLPSIVAASAVFLARWTLDQSDHPWTPTLEHYTSYKSHQLETTVLELRDLQLNTAGCRLNAIREKYRHSKFHSVATLSSPNLGQELFIQEPLDQ
ncbi:OLC1v1030157C1 [Oldenlandia corymbosa var. corymbosa]|uniref:OLC1v1030157C1 n=1 Tax=Oldenlandia corymbosa var. corymbosa TaxID=529605 RepID=A0AAV1CHA2_OLDCO|nr:OLC1v1030157C1 [Oldenlandia corymbosa var. corymbosa]